jgi:hypothetical protein
VPIKRCRPSEAREPLGRAGYGPQSERFPHVWEIKWLSVETGATASTTKSIADTLAASRFEPVLVEAPAVGEIA